MARRVSGNLPEEVTSFVGRRDELATAKRLLPTTRVLTLLGPGGMGKTRLSRQIGQLVARAFPDGVWLVELADLHDPDLVTLAVAEALNLSDESAAPLPRLTEFLADKRLLLILDNCEHLIEACATLVGRIIATTPDVRVLATSREVLGIPGEQVMPVPPLTVPDSAAGEDSDALQLFIERASAANPGFKATAANRALLTEICLRLEGMPLALELAALRLRMFTPEQILDRLDDTMGLLSAGPRTAPQRQQTIEGAIRWSYDLCTPAEQLLWEQLSVFAGGFDIEAAEAVCELRKGQLIDALTGLVDKSVVMQRYDGDVARYSMLEPIRQFAADRLVERDDRQATRARHREHYRGLAMRGLSAYSSAEDVDWFREMSREHANLRAALRSGLEDEPLETMSTVTVLRPFWEHNRFLSEGYRWLTDALERNPEPTAERAKALSSAASLAALLGDRESAAELVAACLTLAAELDDSEIMAEVSLDRSLLAFADGDRESALALGRTAIELAAAHGQHAIEMDSHAFSFMCAMVIEAPGRTELAERFLELTTEHGPHLMGGLALWTVGIDHWRRGDLEASAEFHGRAIEQLALFERCIWLSSAFEGLAWTTSATGDYDRAARLLGAAETLQRSTIRLADTITVAVGDKERTKVREALGENGFRAAFGAGANLPLDEAIDYALGRAPALPQPDLEPAAPRPAPRRSAAVTAETNILTRREKDVARLVAAGHSNKRIAADLVISIRTAETHVEHILTKLGFTSRTQVAAWAHQHDL
ncbi:LuxR C-terminal-related transcriptional regulator [Nocardia jejuensis]|uniref:LuxR C-terminal-related transcriptional regulator n=1 Tax=Nocardia jejuensis TaxID=328049 RepID=UPI00083735DD|nr:LuxR C-terminal-related transcriptional regulator [Nocardia jejuensis]